jgi:DoxX-like family
LAIGFLAAGSIKVIGTKTSIQMRDHVAVAAALWRVIGALELAAAAGLVADLFNPALGVAAAIGVSLLLAGAVVAHLRVGDAGGASPGAGDAGAGHRFHRDADRGVVRPCPTRLSGSAFDTRWPDVFACGRFGYRRTEP